jgi:hypothetical protein
VHREIKHSHASRIRLIIQKHLHDYTSSISNSNTTLALI